MLTEGFPTGHLVRKNAFSKNWLQLFLIGLRAHPNQSGKCTGKAQHQDDTNRAAPADGSAPLLNPVANLAEGVR